MRQTLSWQSLARCLEVDPEIFFPERGGSSRAARAFLWRQDLGQKEPPPAGVADSLELHCPPFSGWTLHRVPAP